MERYLEEYIDASISAVAGIRAHATPIQAAADALVASLSSGGTVFFAGNGGSASDAQHLAAELMGRFELERPALKAICLNTDTSVLTALANDYDYDTIFSRQIEGHGSAGDVAVLISTSGRSRNILAAARAARDLGVCTIGLTGPVDSPLAECVDIALAVGGLATSHVQEAHITIGHAICGYVEQRMFPPQQ